MNISRVIQSPLEGPLRSLQLLTTANNGAGDTQLEKLSGAAFQAVTWNPEESHKINIKGHNNPSKQLTQRGFKTSVCAGAQYEMCFSTQVVIEKNV